MCPEGTLKAYMRYPADSFPGQTAAVPDFNPAHLDPQPTFNLPIIPILLKSDPTKVGQTG